MRTLSALIVEILRSRRMLVEAEDAAGHHVKAPLGVSSEMEERIHLISAVLLTTALNADFMESLRVSAIPAAVAGANWRRDPMNPGVSDRIATIHLRTSALRRAIASIVATME